jgi:hypothetical protein
MLESKNNALLFRRVISAILFMLGLFAFFGCAFQSRQAQPLIVSSVEPTEEITPYPGETFHFGATPELSKIGGINDVFYRESAPSEQCAQNYSIFRFYDDGLVIYVPICENNAAGETFRDNVWPRVSTWFHRDNNDTVLSRGIYHIVENKIWFTTIIEFNSKTGITDRFGTFSEDWLILDSFSHSNGYQETNVEFIRLDVSTNP